MDLKVGGEIAPKKKGVVRLLTLFFQKWSLFFGGKTKWMEKKGM